jgi:hypothetical protein
MKKKDNIIPPKVRHSSGTEYKDTVKVEMQDKVVKSLVVKMINDLKED